MLRINVSPNSKMIKVPVEVSVRCEESFKGNEEFSMIYGGKEIEIVNFESNLIINQFNSTPYNSTPKNCTLVNFSIVKKFRENINHQLLKEPEDRIQLCDFEGDFTFKCSNPKVKFLILWAKFDSNYQNLSVSTQEV